MKRAVIIAVATIVVCAAVAPFIPLNFLKPGIEKALARRLGRRVNIDNVALTLVRGPGLAFDGVTIQEDPRAGIEPFAYAGSVDAELNLLALLGGQWDFSALRLSDATVNIVHTDQGPWNFMFMDDASRRASLPSIRMRGARINLKFGQTKSVLYFTDVDLDISPGSAQRVDLRFSGVPARTDQSAQDFAHFFVNGSISPSAQGTKVDLKLELEPSGLDGLARLIGHPAFSLQGYLSMNAQVSGFASNLNVDGDLQIEDTRHSTLLASRGNKWRLAYRGTLDLNQQTLQLATPQAASQQLSAEFRVSNLLGAAEWSASAALNGFPVSALIQTARQLGAPVPGKITSEGTITGTVECSSSKGLVGELTLNDVDLSLPEGQALRAETAKFTVSNEGIGLSSATVKVGDNQAVQVEGRYRFGDTQAAELKISSRALSIASARAISVDSVPFLRPVIEGTWRGTAQMRRVGGADITWSAEYELVNAKIAVDGLAAPVKVTYASVVVAPDRVTTSRVTGFAGEIPFKGEYRLDGTAFVPHKFRMHIEEASAQQIENLFRPALDRSNGFLQRTLGIGSAPAVPDWLANRKAEGTISIGNLRAGDHSIRIDNAQVLWEGTVVKFSGIKGRIDDAKLSGQAVADLSGRVPKYRAEGSIENFEFKNGMVDLTGSVECAGSGSQRLASLRIRGEFRGRGIDFAPEAEFRTVAGRFETRVKSDLLQWNFTDLDIAQGTETYSGEGVTQPDGKLVLELTGRGRQVRYTGSLLASSSQP